MILLLHRIDIKNFKGLREFNTDFTTGQTVIQGKNGIGKTTIADAWYWLLSDSDSLGQTKFNAIALDQDGLPVNHQDAEVSALIIADLIEIRLKKIYRQKWTKKRGQAMAELTGHTTEYFFDDIPVSKKVYTEKLANLIPPDMIRTLSDPWHFCGRISADARRKILVDLSGDIAQADIIASEPSLAALPDVLGGRSIEDAKKITLQNRKKANEQLAALPERIDELRRMMPESPARSEDTLRHELSEIKKMISEKADQITLIKSGGATNDLIAHRAIIQTELEDASRIARMKHQTVIDDMTAELKRIQNKITENVAGMEALNKKIESISAELQKNHAERAELMAEWKRTKEDTYKPQEICFACGQAIPAHKIADQLSEFNLHKSARLKKINESGMQLHLLAQNMVDEKDRLSEQYVALSKQSQTLSVNLKNQRAALEIETSSMPLAIFESTQHIKAKIDDIDAKIKNALEDINPIVAFENEALSTLESQKAEIEKALLDYAQMEKVTRRIAEREADRAAAGDAFMIAERDLFIIERYYEQLNKFIEENVSKHFTLIKWKLFEQQVNGGQREICEACVGGVPYGTDLNTGAKIMAGLDVIQTLSEHHDIYLPIFVDNAEAVTSWRITPTPQQMIKLIAADVDRLEIK